MITIYKSSSPTISARMLFM